MLLGMSRLEPLLEEFLIALVLMTVLAVIVALLFGGSRDSRHGRTS